MAQMTVGCDSGGTTPAPKGRRGVLPTKRGKVCK
nr:MAG TPA: hypothetical protein [Caudoviricetes sp.]